MIIRSHLQRGVPAAVIALSLITLSGTRPLISPIHRLSCPCCGPNPRGRLLSNRNITLCSVAHTCTPRLIEISPDLTRPPYLHLCRRPIDPIHPPNVLVAGYEAHFPSLLLTHMSKPFAMELLCSASGDLKIRRGNGLNTTDQSLVEHLALKGSINGDAKS